VTLAEFEQQVFAVAMRSPVCGIPMIRRLTPTSINLRLDVIPDGFIDVFYNEQTETVAYTLIQDGRRVFGTDNAGDWHFHPFGDPDRRDPLAGAMSLAEFVTVIERHLTSAT
jgi:hypothetical protein